MRLTSGVVFLIVHPGNLPGSAETGFCLVIFIIEVLNIRSKKEFLAAGYVFVIVKDKGSRKDVNG